MLVIPLCLRQKYVRQKLSIRIENSINFELLVSFDEGTKIDWNSFQYLFYVLWFSVVPQWNMLTTTGRQHCGYINVSKFHLVFDRISEPHTDALNIKILHQSVAFRKTFAQFDAICRTMRHEIKSRSHTAACSVSGNAEEVKNATDSQVNATKNFSGDGIHEEREDMEKNKTKQKTSTRTFFPCVLRRLLLCIRK